MPETFPHYDPDTDELRDRTYYDMGEVAALLHVSQSFIHQRVREGVWDALRVAGRYYMSAAQVGAAVEQMQTAAHAEPEPVPVQLGEPVSDVDLEPLR